MLYPVPVTEPMVLLGAEQVSLEDLNCKMDFVFNQHSWILQCIQLDMLGGKRVGDGISPSLHILCSVFSHPPLTFFIFFFFCIAFPKGLQEKPSLQRAQKRKFTPQAISVNQFPTTGTDPILNIWLLMLADLPTLLATGLCHGFAQKGGLKGQIPD